MKNGGKPFPFNYGYFSYTMLEGKQEFGELTRAILSLASLARSFQKELLMQNKSVRDKLL